MHVLATDVAWMLHYYYGYYTMETMQVCLASQLIHIYVYVYTGIKIIHEQQQLACTPDPMNIYIQVGRFSNVRHVVDTSLC